MTTPKMLFSFINHMALWVLLLLLPLACSRSDTRNVPPTEPAAQSASLTSQDEDAAKSMRCTSAAVEADLAKMTDADLRKLLGLPSAEDEEEDFDPTGYETLVGAFRDKSCHEVLIVTGTQNEPNFTAEIYALEESGLVKKVRLEGFDFLGKPVRTLDFDRDGVDEFIAEIGDMDTTAEGPNYTDASVHKVSAENKLLELWRGRVSFDDRQAKERGPFTIRKVELSFQDVDNDGVEELLTRSEESIFFDHDLTRRLGNPEVIHKVFKFSGSEFLPLTTGEATTASPSDGPLLSFKARLSRQDHYNQKTGRPLKYARHVIRQDRVLFHAKKTPDPEDTADSIYNQPAERAALVELLKGSISDRDERIIMAGTPLVEVTVWPDRATVEILRN